MIRALQRLVRSASSSLSGILKLKRRTQYLMPAFAIFRVTGGGVYAAPLRAGLLP